MHDTAMSPSDNSGQADARRGSRAPKPLTGITVVDFSRLLPGAYCTWLLATLGADVIKVEQPGKGDYQRDVGLQFGEHGSAVFQLVNQGKRSIGLDLKNPEARPVLGALLAKADVVVESFRPGVAARLGIDFDVMRRERPALVCVSINGFGSNSPLRHRAAHDINYLAESGLMSRLIRAGNGIPDVPLVDLVGGGLIPALSTLALLLRAKIAGIGGVADMSLADAMPLLPYEALAATLAGLPEPDAQSGQYSGNAPNYGVYELKDGHVAVGAVEEQFWNRFVEIMALGDTDEDPERLRQRIAGRFRTMTRDDVEALFGDDDVCVSVVKSYKEVMASDHAAARAFTRPPSAEGAMPRLASPFFHDGKRAFAEGVAPRLGQDNDEVMAMLGFSDDEVRRLAASGVVGSVPAN